MSRTDAEGGVFRSRKSGVRKKEMTRIEMKDVERILLASSLSPCPSLIAIRGEPPRPISTANEDTREVTGTATPTPARARAPSPGILPMNIRSTIAYRTLTA